MQSPLETVIPYNRPIYRPYAERIWKDYRAGKYLFIDTAEGAYVTDAVAARASIWPPEAVLSANDIWFVLFGFTTWVGSPN